MDSLDDWRLLDEFVSSGSRVAFEGLVKRHSGWLYALSRRRVNSADVAEDVTQATFIVLARKARNISRRESLAAWLYRVASYAAADALRRQGARVHHERLAAKSEVAVAENAETEAVAGCLHAALDSLSARDREAIILRYFNDQTLEQIGRSQRVAASTVQRRLERSLTRIGYLLKRNGIATVPAGIVAALVWTGTCAAPPSVTAGLAAMATAAGALPAQTASPVGLAKGTLKAMTFMKLKAAAAVLAFIGVGTGGIVIARAIALAVSQTVPGPVPLAPSAPAQAEVAASGDDGAIAGQFKADWKAVDLHIVRVNPANAAGQGQGDSQTLSIQGVLQVVDSNHVLGLDRFDSGKVTRIIDDNGRDLTALAKPSANDMRWYQPLMYNQQFDNNTSRFVDVLQPQSFNFWLKADPPLPRRLAIVEGYLNMLTFDRKESVDVPFVQNGPPVAVLGVQLHFSSITMNGDNFAYQLRADDPGERTMFDGQVRSDKPLPDRMVSARYFVDSSGKPVGEGVHPFGNFERVGSINGSGGLRVGEKVAAMRFEIAIGLHERKLPVTLKNIDLPGLPVAGTVRPAAP